MQSVTDLVNNFSDKLFGGADGMSSGMKMALIIIGVILLVGVIGLIVYLLYSKMSSFSSRRLVGSVYPTDRQLGVRGTVLEPAVSNYDLDGAALMRRDAGLPYHRDSMYPHDYMPDMDNVKCGFTSVAKPDANCSNAFNESFSHQPVLAEQVPASGYQPRYSENDMINMAHL